MNTLYVDVIHPVENNVKGIINIDGIGKSSFDIGAGSQHLVFDVDIIVPPGSVISIELDPPDSGILVDIMWEFSVPSGLNITLSNPLSWVRDHTRVKKGLNEYAHRIYNKKGLINEISAVALDPVPEDIVIYLLNATKDTTIATPILSGERYGHSTGELLFDATDEIILKTTGLPDDNIINVEWMVFNDEDEINLGPSALDFVWFSVKSGVYPDAVLWEREFNYAEYLMQIEISLDEPTDGFTLQSIVRTSDDDKIEEIVIPSTATHVVFTPNQILYQPCTFILGIGKEESLPTNINVNMILAKDESTRQILS